MVDPQIFFLYMFAHFIGFFMFLIIRITAAFLGK